VPTTRTKYFEFMTLEATKEYPKTTFSVCTTNNNKVISEGIFLVSESEDRDEAIEFIDLLIKDLQDLKKKVK
jgi:ABC-type molybdate transport system substrate-binding protein